MNYPKNIFPCTTCPTSNCLIRQYCKGSSIHSLEVKKAHAIYHKNQLVIRENDSIHGIFIVQHGKFKIFITGLNGQPQIVRLAGDGEILGHWNAKKDYYRVSATALEDSKICFIDHKVFYDACLDNPELSLGIMSYVTEMLMNAHQRIRCLAKMNVRMKIVETLLYIKKSFGVNEDNELNVYLTREEIANLAGTSAELVIRQMSILERENIIAKEGKKIILLKESRLKDIVNERENAILKR